MNCPGSRKQDITTKISLYLSNIGFTITQCAELRTMIHKKYKTDECLEILKEMKTKSTRSGVLRVLVDHHLINNFTTELIAEEEKESSLLLNKGAKMNKTNDQYVNFMCPVNLAQYIAELTKQNVAYVVIKETNGSHSVKVTGY